MADRIPSDHASLPTVRATLVRSGALDRPKVEIPADETDRFPHGDLVRVVAGGTEYRVRIESPLSDDGREIRGLYESPRLARNPDEGENLLGEWVDDAGVDVGGSVLVDVIEPGFKYGLREPGERAFYDAPDLPDDNLADIAEQLDG